MPFSGSISFMQNRMPCFHRKKNVVIDETKDHHIDREAETNDRASNILMPRDAWEPFVVESPHRDHAVQTFANLQEWPRHRRWHASPCRSLAWVASQHAQGAISVARRLTQWVEPISCPPENPDISVPLRSRLKNVAIVCVVPR